MGRFLSVVVFILLIPGEYCATCPALQHPDIRILDIRLKPQSVPPKLTTYACQQFQVLENETFQAVAFEPLIGNEGVVHHMLLFGCERSIGTFAIHQCGGVDGSCRAWLTQYSLGVRGPICLPEDVGATFGKNSFTKMLLQVHWNNKNVSNNITDDSGFRIYYTTRLRKHDLGNIQIGQNDISIPPLSETIVRGSCSRQCTRIFPHPIYLTRTYIHMHYLGIKGRLEICRNGSFHTLIAKDEEYTYDKSPIHDHHMPIEVLPSDEIRLTCTFNTRDGQRRREETVYFGEGSEAEMCFAFVSYFPRIRGFDQCIQMGDRNINC
ncbi:dopamine beta-hydroxylase-like isoform X2 [Saccostrea cucullata]|uniref:dopamine beta-hydroxylase-like isoform X2 n=1 Tax=Saccostrea cuccullata TaxID=36930 RepID=UPI002ED5BA7E